MSAPAATPSHVLVVDDEPDLRTLYELTLLREGYRVDTAGSLAEAWQLLEDQRFDAVITDMRLPDGLGLELLHGMLTRHRSERCIVMTAYGSTENAVEALKAGAFDYLTKPVDLKQFRAVVASAIQDSPTAMPVTAPAATRSIRGTLAPRKVGVAQDALLRLVGESDCMRTVKERIAKVARSMAPVLVRGESGTGKELAARALHACSHRSSGPFVAVNCSAIPENLMEAEFFGARKGSYTGASADREGYFQAARGGTLFLDEIGDLPLAMQSKLLRAIQERQVRSLGSIQEDAVDVRIVSATHKDLALDVQDGRFRQDLYYRLNVIDILLPPLRERRSDLPALCEALLSRIAQESGLPTPRLSHALLQQLLAHPLHGNVRELENLLHRAVTLSDGDELLAEPEAASLLEQPPSAAAPSSLATSPAAREPVDATVAAQPASAPPRSDQLTEATGEPSPGTTKPLLELPNDLQAYLDQQERDILVRALRENGFNRTAAAARLGMSLRQIRYRITRLAIAMPHGDDAPDDGG